ncbi:MAG: DUF1064 domain-containing protein [bacterium]
MTAIRRPKIKQRARLEKSIAADIRKPHKYGACATVIDGIRFASKREAERYAELKLLERMNIIQDLFIQPRFRMPPGFAYVADFQYTDANGQSIVEDVKGVETPVFKLKRKCLEYFYPKVRLEIIK